MSTIRAERPGDRDAVRRVHELAFGRPEEADLVDALREEGALELSLVALEGEAIVAHVALSRATLDSGPEILALAPIGVLPDRQRQGVGSELMRESLRRAARTDFPLVVLVGHPEYYPRFGFEPGHEHGVIAPFEVPPEVWMVLALPRHRPEARGTVRYPSAFESV